MTVNRFLMLLSLVSGVAMIAMWCNFTGHSLFSAVLLIFGVMALANGMGNWEHK